MAHAKKTIVKATYNFAVDGGAISTITPAVTGKVPVGAIPVMVRTVCRTPVTSGGAATIAITAGGLTLVPATAYTNNAFDTANQVTDVTTLLNASLGGIATSSANIQVVIAGAATTAGKIDVYVEYIGA